VRLFPSPLCLSGSGFSKHQLREPQAFRFGKIWEEFSEQNVTKASPVLLGYFLKQPTNKNADISLHIWHTKSSSLNATKVDKPEPFRKKISSEPASWRAR
jgi:hypothetical protein